MDGHREVAPADVVLDDILQLGAGDQVIVDGGVAEADGLEVDESLLTGETDPMRQGARRRGDVGQLRGRRQRRVHAPPRSAREAYAAQLAAEASRFTLVSSELRSGIDTILQLITY